MLVELRFGSRAGEVVDFPPYEARTMLADGRAVAVVEAEASTATLASRIEAREDRAMPRTKRRATR